MYARLTTRPLALLSGSNRLSRSWLFGAVKGKGIPITGHEVPRGMWMQGSTYSQQRHWEEIGTFGRLYPGTHSIGGWVDPRTRLDTKD